MTPEEAKQYYSHIVGAMSGIHGPKKEEITRRQLFLGIGLTRVWEQKLRKGCALT